MFKGLYNIESPLAAYRCTCTQHNYIPQYCRCHYRSAFAEIEIYCSGPYLCTTLIRLNRGLEPGGGDSSAS